MKKPLTSLLLIAGPPTLMMINRIFDLGQGIIISEATKT
jgi:hypothetical protein